MKNNLYNMVITNAKVYLKTLTIDEKINNNCYTAFEIADILSIVLAKDKYGILQDILDKKFKGE